METEVLLNQMAGSQEEVSPQPEWKINILILTS